MGTAYIATYRVPEGSDYRVPEGSGPLASIVLPRDIVESAVLDAAPVSLELRLDGTVVVYSNNSSLRTLAMARVVKPGGRVLPDLS